MKHYQSTILFSIGFISIIIVTNNIGNANSQTSQKDPALSDLYLKLSDLIKNTGDDVVHSMSAIESGDNKTALNILANVTINLQEISNGLNVMVNEPITRGNSAFYRLTISFSFTHNIQTVLIIIFNFLLLILFQISQYHQFFLTSIF